MGKYSNVSVSSLKAEANRAISELGSNNLDSIIDTLSNKSILDSSASEVLRTAMNSINSSSKTGSISTLKNNLQKLVSGCGYISEYQKLEKEVAELETRKYKTVTKSRYWTDDQGKTHSSSYQTTEIDQNVVNQINTKQEQMKKAEANADSAFV